MTAAIVAQSTSDDPARDVDEGENPAAGKQGGKVRAGNLTSEQRSAIRVAAAIGWSSQERSL